MKKLGVLFCCLIVFNCAPAQVSRYITSTPCLSAPLYAKKSADPFSSVINPATLLFTEGISAGMYTERKFMTEGLELAVISAVIGGKASAGGINFRYFGNADFNEIHTGIGYGKRLGDVDLAVSFNYSVYTIAGFKNQSGLGITVASIWKLSDKVCASLRLSNPPLRKKNNSEEQEAAEYALGFGFDASAEVHFAIEIIRRQNNPLQAIASLHYNFAEKFYAKAGLLTNNAQPFFGAGWRWKNFRVEVSVSYHVALGSSPGASLIYYKEKSTR